MIILRVTMIKTIKKNEEKLKLVFERNWKLSLKKTAKKEARITVRISRINMNQEGTMLSFLINFFIAN